METLRIPSPYPLLLLAIVTLNFGIWRGQTEVWDFFELKASQETLQDTVAKLSQEIRELELEISRVKHSPDYAQKLLRDRYHETKPGEEFIFIEE